MCWRSTFPQRDVLRAGRWLHTTDWARAFSLVQLKFFLEAERAHLSCGDLVANVEIEYIKAPVCPCPTQTRSPWAISPEGGRSFAMTGSDLYSATRDGQTATVRTLLCTPGAQSFINWQHPAVQFPFHVASPAPCFYNVSVNAFAYRESRVP